MIILKKKRLFPYIVSLIKELPIFDLAATLAFYFMLSIFPLLIFMLTLIPYFQLEVETIYSFVRDYFPDTIAHLFETTVLEVVSKRQGGLLSFGILATIWSASNGVNALMRAVNRSYKIEETRHFLKLRTFSIMITISLVFIIVLTLLLPVFGNIILQTLQSLFFVPDKTAIVLNRLRWIIGISFMIITLMFVYRIAPNVRITFKEAIFGAIVATFGWQIVSFAFSIYISNFANYSATYGSLGGVIALMFWFFLTGLILIIGGIVNAAIYHTKQ